jgi:hypothetical protein
MRTVHDDRYKKNPTLLDFCGFLENFSKFFLTKKSQFRSLMRDKKYFFKDGGRDVG